MKLKNRGDDTIFIFDLDGTTVDSRHRTSLPFSLDYWNENSTRENILRDRLMPLSRKMVELINLGYEVIICTARTLGKYDYEYLYDIIGLPNDIKIISRAKEDTRENHIYKKSNLQYLVNLKPFKDRQKILIDDEYLNRITFASMNPKCASWNIHQAERFFIHFGEG